MELKDFETIIKEEIITRNIQGDGGYLFLPFSFNFYPEWLGIFIEFTEEGLPIFNDAKYIYNYYEERGFDFNSYLPQINRICQMFDLTLDDKHFIFNCESNSSNYLNRAINNFLQALTLLGNLDILK